MEIKKRFFHGMRKKRRNCFQIVLASCKQINGVCFRERRKVMRLERERESERCRLPQSNPHHREKSERGSNPDKLNNE